jgi:hypothetical protein
LDGNGTQLWMLNVSYDALNASKLLEEKGYYLVFKMIYSDPADGTEQWYAFTHAFYLEEFESHNSTGYLNGYIHSVQFAVVDVKPDDEHYGAYDHGSLDESNFIATSEIFYNQHFTISAL